jgi:parvulin-like peptidyl-prolyl isomerase
MGRNDLSQGLRSIFSVTSYPQVIKPIATAKGFHLIWVEEIIKATLGESTYQEIQSQLFKEFLSEKLAVLASKIDE